MGFLTWIRNSRWFDNRLDPQVFGAGQRGSVRDLLARHPEMAAGRAANRSGVGSRDHRHRAADPKRHLGHDTSVPSRPSRRDHSGDALRLPAHRAHHAIFDARSGSPFYRGDHPVVPRASGRHRHASVLVQAAGRGHHGGFRRQRGVGGTEHLRRRRDRLVAMDQAQTPGVGARATRPAHHADQRRGGRNGGGVSRTVDRTDLRARDAVQGRPRARGAVAVAHRLGGFLRGTGRLHGHGAAVRLWR